jgi:hypothetical protein
MIFAIVLRRAGRCLNHRFHRIPLATFAVCALAICAGEVGAAVVNTSGDVEQIAAPTSVVLNALEHSLVARLFLEREAFTLPSDLALDVTQPGLVDSASDLTPGQLTTGTAVTSYLIHADAPQPVIPIREYQGSITFDMPILGAIIDADLLNASDLIVGSPSTNYVPRNPDSGFEGPGFPVISPGVRDELTLSPDMRTISFHLRVESRLDQVRVIIAAVPEPSSVCLLLVAFSASLFGHRKRC